jgi:hypothetical protein
MNDQHISRPKKRKSRAVIEVGTPAPSNAAIGTASFVRASANRKLSPVAYDFSGLRPRSMLMGPFASATNASVAATCSDGCPFKSGGCYTTGGSTRYLVDRLDAAAVGCSADQVIAEQARLIDAAFDGGSVPQDGANGGRDLRLNVAGDVGSTVGALLLAGAAQRWSARGGGHVWTFTHTWEEISRDAWGSISVLASVECAADIERARERGYAAAIVVAELPSAKKFTLPESSATIVPCPAETLGETCVECRLCLNADKLFDRNTAIAFAADGPGSKQVREKLVQIGLRGGRRVGG